jgi:FdhD protein
MTVDEQQSTSVLRHVWTPEKLSSSRDQVAVESPVALVYNGISHVVMMTTPTDLEDFAYGFSLSEGIACNVSEILDYDEIYSDIGVELHVTLANEAFSKLKQRRRNLVGRTGCGLCGAESLAQARPADKLITTDIRLTHRALQKGIGELSDWQSLQQQTGAVHGAAWCDEQGNIILIREDVGRHNALDKLIGSMLREGLSKDGFVIVSSRASYEMVVKMASANLTVLAAVSAPTSLAIELAEGAGLTLVGFSRVDRHVIYSNEQRFESEIS